jgi:hypothetical protein
VFPPRAAQAQQQAQANALVRRPRSRIGAASRVLRAYGHRQYICVARPNARHARWIACWACRGPGLALHAAAARFYARLRRSVRR